MWQRGLKEMVVMHVEIAVAEVVQTTHSQRHGKLENELHWPATGLRSWCVSWRHCNRGCCLCVRLPESGM